MSVAAINVPILTAAQHGTSVTTGEGPPMNATIIIIIVALAAMVFLAVCMDIADARAERRRKAEQQEVFGFTHDEEPR